MSDSVTTHQTTDGAPNPPRGLGFQAMIVNRAAAQLTSRVMLRGIFAAVLVATMALEGIRFGYVERPMALSAAYQDVDPVVASVGNELLRVSDAFAHAALLNGEEAANEDVPTLIASGTLDAAADHAALAQAARTAGIDDALEIRAALALAERQILAEAYLDRVAASAVTENAIRARYEEESAVLAQDSVMRLSKIVVSSRDEAESIAARLPRADFGALAREHSIDMESREDGGRLGEVRSGDLPAELAAAAQGLTIGGTSEPVETDEGWAILKLEARRALRLPPLSERRDEIAEALKQEAIAAALEGAREEAPVRLRSAQAITAEIPRPMTQTIASARSL